MDHTHNSFPSPDYYWWYSLFRFLWGTYRPSVYWYECWECVRKLLLTGLLVYFKEGTPTQVTHAH